MRRFLIHLAAWLVAFASDGCLDTAPAGILRHHAPRLRAPVSVRRCPKCGRVMDTQPAAAEQTQQAAAPPPAWPAPVAMTWIENEPRQVIRAAPASGGVCRLT